MIGPNARVMAATEWSTVRHRKHIAISKSISGMVGRFLRESIMLTTPLVETRVIKRLQIDSHSSRL